MTAASWAAPTTPPIDQMPLLAAAEQDTDNKSSSIVEEPLKQAKEGAIKAAQSAASQAVLGLVNQAKKAMDDNELEKQLEKDIRKEGLMIGLVGALTLLYDTISDTLLYPFFSFLFVAMTIALVILVVRLATKYRKDSFVGARRMLFVTAIFLLIYIDLFLVIYEQRKIVFLFLELKKDILLIAVAAMLGFFRGRFASRRDFEEKVVP